MRGHTHYQFSLVVFPDDGCIICAGNEALGRALDNMTVHGISQHAQSHNCAPARDWYTWSTRLKCAYTQALFSCPGFPAFGRGDSSRA